MNRENFMFLKTSEEGYHSPLSGIEQKTLVYGENTLMTEFRLKKGSILPLHRHPHEQTGYLISGRIRLTINGKSHDCAPGDSWCIPSDADHGADVIEDAVAVEVFSPVRKEYIPT
jgi:quercetin dioxygenase-like cupin family protein